MDVAEAPHLMEVVRRVKTPEDAEVAMEVARQYALQRAHRQQHDGLSPNMSYLILKVHCLLKLCSKQPALLTSQLVQCLATGWQPQPPVTLPTSPSRLRLATQDAPYS